MVQPRIFADERGSDLEPSYPRYLRLSSEKSESRESEEELCDLIACQQTS